MKRAALTLLALLAAAYLDAADVPRVDLEGAEAPVAASIDAAAKAVKSTPQNADAWGRYAMTLHAHSFRPEAEQSYAEAQRLAPRDFRWSYFRGINLMKIDSTAAVTQLERAVDLDGVYGPAFVRLGIALEEAGHGDDARRCFAEALRLRPEDTSAHLHMGQLELQAGNLAPALHHLETARTGRPNDRGVLAALARAYARTGDIERAREAAAAAREAELGSVVDDPRFNQVIREAVMLRAFLDRASVFSAGGNYERAVRELERAIQVGHEPGVLQHQIAREYLLAHNFAKSIEACRVAMTAGIDTAAIHAVIATAFMYSGQLDEAEQAVRDALERSSSNTQALWLNGRIAFERGDDLEAVARWDQALEIEDYPRTRTDRAEAISRLGRHDEAIVELETLCATRPHDSSVWLALGGVRERTGDLDGAVADFDKALERASIPLAGRRAVSILTRQRRFAEAETRLRAMRDRWPDNPNLRNELAWLLSTCPDAAIRDGREAMTLITPLVRQTSRRRPGILDTLAAALAESGQTEQAVRVMDEALALLPASTPAKRRLSYEAHRTRYKAGSAWRDGS